MSINGKYESYESETFMIQLSMDDLTALDNFFLDQITTDGFVMESRVQVKKFMEMVHQASSDSEFGFDYFHIDK